MSDTQDIRRALEKKLDGIAGLPKIAWENSKFNPDGQETWIRPNLTIFERRPASVGVNSAILYRGLFLLDCYGKQNKGTDATDTLADTLLTNFAYGTILTENSKDVRIRFAERAGALKDDPWYYVPVTITWYAYI